METGTKMQSVSSSSTDANHGHQVQERQEIQGYSGFETSGTDSPEFAESVIYD
jgi:hypothetical protein